MRWMITIFGFYFFFFAVVDGSLGPSLPRAGEFWWGDVALIPAIVLTSGALLQVRPRFGDPGLWLVRGYLVVNALFFVAVTKEGPILAWLGTSHEEVVSRLPFLF